MGIVAEYRRWALEAEQFAQTVISDESRRMILELARSCGMMADQRERHLNAVTKTACAADDD